MVLADVKIAFFSPRIKLELPWYDLYALALSLCEELCQSSDSLRIANSLNVNDLFRLRLHLLGGNVGLLILPALADTHNLSLVLIRSNIVPQRSTALRFMVITSLHSRALHLVNRFLDLFL